MLSRHPRRIFDTVVKRGRGGATKTNGQPHTSHLIDAFQARRQIDAVAKARIIDSIIAPVVANQDAVGVDSHAEPVVMAVARCGHISNISPILTKMHKQKCANKKHLNEGNPSCSHPAHRLIKRCCILTADSHAAASWRTSWRGAFHMAIMQSPTNWQ